MNIELNQKVGQAQEPEFCVIEEFSIEFDVSNIPDTKIQAILDKFVNSYEKFLLTATEYTAKEIFEIYKNAKNRGSLQYKVLWSYHMTTNYSNLTFKDLIKNELAFYHPAIYSIPKRLIFIIPPFFQKSFNFQRIENAVETYLNSFQELSPVKKYSIEFYDSELDPRGIEYTRN